VTLLKPESEGHQADEQLHVLPNYRLPEDPTSADRSKPGVQFLKE
jgi:hypothetical protein